MGSPAARVQDDHTCPLNNPPPTPTPHKGGAIMPPLPAPGTPPPAPVLIGGKPAATVGCMCVCVGPPDSIIKGSGKVMINNKPAARLGDTTAHGGKITTGCTTVLIG